MKYIKGFLSYSHDDKDVAEKIANELKKSGVDVWFDKWEINPGDSLVQKIFLEGLHNCEVFFVLLSKKSVVSKWVKEELSNAIVKKLNEETKIIPILIEECEIPSPLQTLLWVDLSENFDNGIMKIVKSVYNVNEKPPIGKIPDYISELNNSVGGLSKKASTMGKALLNDIEKQDYIEKIFDNKTLHKLISFLSVQDINDSVEELEEYGLVRVGKYLGTTPYHFGDIVPTYALFLHFENSGLSYSPTKDIKMVASAIVAQNRLDGFKLKKLVDINSKRINRAIEYLDDYGLIETIKYFGTAPYNFGQVNATRKTREFVSNNCT